MGTFIPNQYKGGLARSSTGDEGCIASNSDTEIFFEPPVMLAEMTAYFAGPPKQIIVTKHPHFIAGLVLQLTHPTDESLSIMVEVRSVIPYSATESKLVLLPGSTVDASFVGAAVSINQNFLRPEVVYGSAAEPLNWSAVYAVDGVSYQQVSVAGAQWVGNQWVGCSVVSGGALENEAPRIVAFNDQDLLTVFAPGPALPSTDTTIAIAKAYSGFTVFSDRVPTWRLTLLGKNVTTLLEPSLDLERLGTEWYGHNHLLAGGQGASPGGVSWDNSDTGVTITTPGIKRVEVKAMALSNGNIRLDVETPTDLVTNAYVGDFLNPNPLQTQLFKIVSNTANSITVDSPLDAAFQKGALAYVLGERDAVKYNRLLAQLKTYVNPDARVHILFT